MHHSGAREIWAAVTLAGVLVSTVADAASPPASAARDDAVTAWSALASSSMAAAGMSPLRQPLTLALVHLAMYDAVAVTTARYPAYTGAPAIQGGSPEAAVVEAAYAVLAAELPSARPALEAARRQSLSASPVRQHRAWQAGAAAGRRVADLLLARRAADGRDAAGRYAAQSGAGHWVPTPPGHLPAAGAFLAQVTPFVLPRAASLRPPGPPPLASARYAADYDEVKRLGGMASTARTAAQTATARFWEPLALTVWPATVRRLAAERALDLVASARLQAAAFVAFADAMIACWDAKLTYGWWRPVTAIAAAADDGNPATAPAPGWQPLGMTPNFPEYPSGHASITAAVSAVIEQFFAAGVEIPAVNVLTGEERRFRSASAVTAEVIEARMLLGVHFRTANEDGARMGRAVGDAVTRRLLRP